MDLKKLFILLVLIAFKITTYCQEFSTEDQYNQAMQNAKTAFEANQYSQAVMFYREALNIKPDALLPKYKIEDIRTIYIKNELESLQKAEPVITEKPKKKKKEIEAEQVILAQKAEEIATEKMYKDADDAKQELQEIVKSSEKLVINDSVLEIDEEIIEDIQPDRETSLTGLNAKEANKISNDNASVSKDLTVTTREIPEVELPEEEPEVVELPKKDSIIPTPEPVKTQVKVVSKPVQSSTPVKNEAWIQKEHERLAKIYPNKKTVEVIEKQGKVVTRVVMNIDGKVTTYLKVYHSWGATYYFVDEVGLELRSISQTHFNRMTDLNTYDKN